jgi:hypothetical protein
MNYDDYDFDEEILSPSENMIPNPENMIPTPLPSYSDRLLEGNEVLRANGLPEIDEELEKAIQASLKNNDDELENILTESLIEYEVTNNDTIIDEVLQSSLESYESNILNESYNKYLEEVENIKKERSDKLNKFLLQLKRINGLQKNEIIELLIKILESYIENSITFYPVTKDIHKKIFNELKNIRITTQDYDIVNSIIIIENNIDI